MDLQVEPGKAPMKVNSDAQVANLNSDKLDGKSANEIGVNGLGRVGAISASNSESGKGVTATCPTGKVLVSSGYAIGGGGITGTHPTAESDVVINAIYLSDTSVQVIAVEDEPTSANWNLTAVALCATAP